MRNKALKQKSKESWRKTPHIDADAIEALLNLNGDFDTNFLLEGSESKLETCAEEVEPSPPAGETQKKTHVTKFEESPSILKKAGHSDSSITMRNAPRKTVTVCSARQQRSTKHQSLYFGSPERSPGSQDLPPTNCKVMRLQKSLSLSHSSPDLYALTSNKTRSKKPKREDSYVTGSGTPKESNRRSFFGSSGLTRSLTISGKGSKKSPAHIREKYKLRSRDDDRC